MEILKFRSSCFTVCFNPRKNKEKKWRVEFQVGEGDGNEVKTRTELMTDQELDKAADHIAAERAAGRHVNLRLATDEDRWQQQQERKPEREHRPDRDGHSPSHEQSHSKGSVHETGRNADPGRNSRESQERAARGQTEAARTEAHRDTPGDAEIGMER